MTLSTGFPSADPDQCWCPERMRGLGKVSYGNLDTTSVTSGFVTLKCSVCIKEVEWVGNYSNVSPFQRKCLSNKIVICSKISSEIKKKEGLFL